MAVPNVGGLDVVSATSQLSNAGLVVDSGAGGQRPRSAGDVIRTDPPTGQTVDKGSEKIVVSSGPAQVGVPW